MEPTIVPDNRINQLQLRALYGESGVEAASRRIDALTKWLGPSGTLISAPGRTELGGNHTDHNLGKVLCAAVRQDSLALVQPDTDGIAKIHSLNLDKTYAVRIDDLDIKAGEHETSTALLRGVLKGMSNLGAEIGGFTAVLHSTVGIGSGLSSSASFEVMLAAIVNEMFNDSKVPAPDLALVGQFAENEYFGKPCGLMDQMSSAVGGIQMIDFRDPVNVKLQDVHFDIRSTDYVLATVNTGSSHADLTPAYASIPHEMKKIATELGIEFLRDASIQQVLNGSKKLREKHGDRAVLRALHFFHENHRIDKMVAALSSSDFEAYLSAVRASGRSSQTVLQNTVPPMTDGEEQGLAYALGMAQLFFEERGRGVGRVHGGGFAGTMQAYVHRDDFDDFEGLMEQAIGPNVTQILEIREAGVTVVGHIP